MKNTYAMFAAVLAMIFAGCAKAPESQGDWTLQKESFVDPGEWIPVALIYGYADDYAACEELLQALKDFNVATSINWSYRCVPGDVRE